MLSKVKLIAIAAVAMTSLSAVASESWPSRPIRLVVGYPAGGPTDIIARLAGQELSKELGQPVVVENKGGGNGLIAAKHVTTQKPDGYTLMLSTDSVQTRAPALYRSLNYDPVADFTPIAKFAKQGVMMVVNPSVPAQNVREFIAYAKQNPGKLNYGATYGASSHFGGALFDVLNGVDMAAINYPGGNQPITDLVGGVVQVGFFTESTVAQFIKAGKLKALAAAGSERSRLFPQIPTLQEAGAAKMDVAPWFGIVAPAKTPPEIVEKLAVAVSKFANGQAFSDALTPLGAMPIKGSTPAKFSEEIKSDVVYWRKFVVDNKFPVEN
ncbi:Bug family tripartite tricarboxylate transporter substrate binding protein [Cupriavidus basilensis]